ncbi:MAG: hypothetical protein ABI767_13690 [Rhodanobacter sp.]
MKTWIATALVFAALASPARSVLATDGGPDAEAQIQKVIKRFQTAVIKKDRAALGDLFLPTNNSWIAVPSAATYRIVKAKHPTAPRFMPDSYAHFIDFVCKTAEPLQETFSNVRIDTDGTVASVYFDYVFLASGERANHGSEVWQLINTGNGWKINALVYSINLDTARAR